MRHRRERLYAVVDAQHAERAVARRLLPAVEHVDATRRRVPGLPELPGAPCPDTKALLRADVIFYDTPSFGNSIDVQTWSDQ